MSAYGIHGKLTKNSSPSSCGNEIYNGWATGRSN